MWHVLFKCKMYFLMLNNIHVLVEFMTCNDASFNLYQLEQGAAAS